MCWTPRSGKTWLRRHKNRSISHQLSADEHPLHLQVAFDFVRTRDATSSKSWVMLARHFAHYFQHFRISRLMCQSRQTSHETWGEESRKESISSEPGEREPVQHHSICLYRKSSRPHAQLWQHTSGDKIPRKAKVTGRNVSQIKTIIKLTSEITLSTNSSSSASSPNDSKEKFLKEWWGWFRKFHNFKIKTLVEKDKQMRIRKKQRHEKQIGNSTSSKPHRQLSDYCGLIQRVNSICRYKQLIIPVNHGGKQRDEERVRFR